MNSENQTIDVTVTAKNQIAVDIVLFELTRSDGGVLPPWEPGAHITVQTPSGANRWYSLCQLSKDQRSYFIAVKREDAGLGGSRSMIEETQVGSNLRIGPPENQFALVDSNAYLLIAAGIGITPIYAMWQTLVEKGHPNFLLVYLTKSPQHTPFYQELMSSKYRENVILHHTNGGSERYDLWDLLAKPTSQHVYCCGPKDLMSEIKDMTGHWPTSRLHFEDFKPVEAVRANDKPFTARIKSNDELIQVAEDETLLHALRKHGVQVSSSCESGTCGSCKTSYLSGQIDHRDLVLEGEELSHYLMPCVSRAHDKEIVLDL